MNNKILEQGRFASTMIDYFRIPMGYSTMLYFIALVLFVVAQHSWANPVTQERLIAGPEEGSDWLAHGRDLSETRYSPLQQITSENISGLGLAWSFDLPDARGLERTLTIDQGENYSISGAPRVANGVVIIGNAGSEYGVRGYVGGYAADTGELLWRFYTVPGNPADGFESPLMEMAAKTWNGQWWTMGGGLEPGIIKLLTDLAQPVAVELGEHFFREGDETSAMYVLQTGQVEIYKTWNSTSKLLRTMSAGDCFGEMALIDLS